MDKFFEEKMLFFFILYRKEMDKFFEEKMLFFFILYRKGGYGGLRGWGRMKEEGLA